MPRMVALEIAGKGPPLVFLHGVPLQPEAFRPLAHALQSTHTTVIVSLPGYGSTPPLAPGWTLEDVHDEIEAALAHSGLSRVGLVGFSGGGYHALALAYRAHVDVTAVALLAGVMQVTPAEGESFHALAAALRAGQDLRVHMRPRMLSPGFRQRHPERVVEVERWLDATSAANLAAELEVFAAAPDLSEKVGALRIPVLARVGAEDVAAPPAVAEAIAKCAPKGQLEVVPGAGHALLIEDLEGTSASLARWFG